MPQLTVARDGMQWVSWPKRPCKVETDLSDNVVREVGLDTPLVDVKVVRCVKDRA